MGQIISDVTDVLDYKENKKQAKAAKKQILRDIIADDMEKQNLVKKVLASQRAKYGAAGMSADGLTEEKVLARLKAETEKPYEDKKQANLKKLKNTKAAKKKNLLTTMIARLEKLLA